MSAVAPPPVARAGPPVCGGCGYNTTGLTSLVCPECGADLRVAGIVRGRRDSGTWAGFFASAMVVLVAWVICGAILGGAASSLLPGRQQFQRDTLLGSPGSGAYKEIDVIGRGSGWVGERPTMSVTLEFVPLSAAGGAPAKPPPPPLRVTQATGAAAVLQWMAQAGLDPEDPRVREEAQAVMMHALRTLRANGRFTSGGYTGNTTFGGAGRAYSRVGGRAFGTTQHPNLPQGVFFTFWVAVFVACVMFLWRAMRPRRGAR